MGGGDQPLSQQRRRPPFFATSQWGPDSSAAPRHCDVTREALEAQALGAAAFESLLFGVFFRFSSRRFASVDRAADTRRVGRGCCLARQAGRAGGRGAAGGGVRRREVVVVRGVYATNTPLARAGCGARQMKASAEVVALSIE